MQYLFHIKKFLAVDVPAYSVVMVLSALDLDTLSRCKHTLVLLCQCVLQRPMQLLGQHARGQAAASKALEWATSEYNQALAWLEAHME